MALGDYILCDRCNCKLIYDGDEGNRQWWIERFGKEPEILCPPCQQEMAMARVQLLGQAMDDVRTRYVFGGALANTKPMGDQWTRTQQTKAYNPKGLPVRILTEPKPVQFIYQGAINPVPGTLLEITAVDGHLVYVKQVSPNGGNP